MARSFKYPTKLRDLARFASESNFSSDDAIKYPNSELQERHHDAAIKGQSIHSEQVNQCVNFCVHVSGSKTANQLRIGEL